MHYENTAAVFHKKELSAKRLWLTCTNYGKVEWTSFDFCVKKTVSRKGGGGHKKQKKKKQETPHLFLTVARVISCEMLSCIQGKWKKNTALRKCLYWIQKS